MNVRIFIVLAVAVLSACQKPAPAARAPAPAIERPVVTLGAKPGERVLIPASALVVRAGMSGVFVVDENELARFRLLRIGKPVGARVEILAGLSGTERLVLGDLNNIRDGSRLRPR